MFGASCGPQRDVISFTVVLSLCGFLSYPPRWSHAFYIFLSVFSHMYRLSVHRMLRAISLYDFAKAIASRCIFLRYLHDSPTYFPLFSIGTNSLFSFRFLVHICILCNYHDVEGPSHRDSTCMYFWLFDCIGVGMISPKVQTPVQTHTASSK